MNQQTIYHLNILIVDDELNIRKMLTSCLEALGHKVVAVSNSADAQSEASRRAFDMAFIDMRLGTEKGLDLLPLLQAISPWIKIVIMTAFASIDIAVQSMKSGSVDFLPKPFTPMEIRHVTQRIAEMRRLEQNVSALQETLGDSMPGVDLQITQSPAMQRAIHLAQKVAVTDAPILIRGESGTGKAVFAKAIHEWSARKAHPFTTVSCPSVIADQCESELFGHVKGAFPSAAADYPGRIALCEGGTIFLDEVGSLPLAVQPKLLRFLQTHQYERLGELAVSTADVRIITATHIDLEQAVREGRLREDLLYRLNVIEILLPPLRERREDILPIARRLLAFFTRHRHTKVLGFSPAAAEALDRYDWPGNIGELRNVIERCAILATGDHVGPELLPSVSPPSDFAASPGDMISLEKLEERHIRRVLATTKSLDEAAAILQIDAATLWRRRKKYGI